MTATKISICNAALSLTGSKLIQDFDTDSTIAGQLCRLHYSDSVEELLERHPWGFATGRVTLTAHAQDAPAFTYDNAFQLPDDFLTVREAAENTNDTPWKIEGRYVYSNLDTIDFVYVKRVDDTSKFTPLFRQALIYLLTAKLAMPLTRSMSMATMYHQKVRELLLEGESASSYPNNEVFEPNLLVDVRLG
jgi:hypothetical protein